MSVENAGEKSVGKWQAKAPLKNSSQLFLLIFHASLCLKSLFSLNLNALNSAVIAKVLDLQKVKAIIDEFRENFFQMQTEFNLSQSLKLHILFDHYVEHFEMTGKAF